MFVEDKKPSTPPVKPSAVKTKPGGGCKVLKPKYPGSHHHHPPAKRPGGLKVLPRKPPTSNKPGSTVTNSKAGWDVLLSESSDDDNADDWTEWKPHQVRVLDMRCSFPNFL